MAHFIRPNGRLDKTYPNQYGHTIPHSWSNKITKQEVHKSYIYNVITFRQGPQYIVWMWWHILNLFGCHLIVVGIVYLVELTFSPTYLFENRNVPTATAPAQTGAQMRERSRTIVRASQQTWVQLLWKIGECTLLADPERSEHPLRSYSIFLGTNEDLNYCWCCT